MIPTLDQTSLDVTVLDIRQFASVDAFRIATEATANRALLLVNQSNLLEVLTWVDEKDDVCLLDSSPELIAHRARCLSRAVEGSLDPLTRVLARQQFDHRLCNSCMESSPDHPISLLLCDLDYFKQINDTHGHALGDQVLCHVANIFKQHCDRSASIGRVGGEQFAIACNRDTQAAVMLAEELRRIVGGQPAMKDVSVTMSFGIATTVEPSDGHVLMQKADQALYAAKANGRNCSISYNEMEATSRTAGDDVDVIGLENHARVLAERVANFITMRSRSLLKDVRKEADVDGLTGCFTRRYMDRRLATEFDNRDSEPYTVAFLDLDYFGGVNKEHGWPSGDKILIDVCETMTRHLRETDWVGRYGGEEFCIIMPNTPAQEAETVLSRIRELIESTQFVSVENRTVPMTVSIGAASANKNDRSFSELLDRAASRALAAKQNGRNQLRCCD